MTKEDNLSFELISDADLIRFTHLNNGETWRNKLTAEEYADREWFCGVEHNPRDEVTKVGLYHFVLRDLSIPDDGSKHNISNILASCETRNRNGWRVEPNGELKQVLAICVGGVYTMPNHRKKGYGSIMITRLNEYWDKKAPKDSFMFLYSEVGEYYSKFGYKSFEVLPHHVPVPEQLPELDTSKFHFLKQEEYPELVKREDDLLKKDLVEKSKTTDKTLVSLAFDMETIEWFHKRDHFIGSKVRPGLKIDKLGATLNDSDDFILWLHDWNSDDLTIISLKYSTLDSFKTLVSLAMKEAKDKNLHSLMFWDSALALPLGGKLHQETLSYLREFKGTTTAASNGSLSAIRLNDGTQNYNWEYNDKWCWF